MVCWGSKLQIRDSFGTKFWLAYLPQPVFLFFSSSSLSLPRTPFFPVTAYYNPKFLRFNQSTQNKNLTSTSVVTVWSWFITAYAAMIEVSLHRLALLADRFLSRGQLWLGLTFRIFTKKAQGTENWRLISTCWAWLLLQHLLLLQWSS